MIIETHGKNIFVVSLGRDRFVNVYVRGNKAEIEPRSHAEQSDISEVTVVRAWESVRDKFSLTVAPVYKTWHRIISYHPQVAMALDGYCGFPGVKSESRRDGQAEKGGGRCSHPMSVEKN